MMVRVSQNIILYWKGGQLICDNFVSQKQHALSPTVEPLLRWFSRWKQLDSLVDLETADLPRSRLYGLARQLLDAGFLVEEGSETHGLEREILDTWDVWGRSAAYFHFSSRTRAKADFYSAAQDTERLVCKAQDCPPPCVYKEYPHAARVPLMEVSMEARNGEANSAGFVDVLLRRRTHRLLDPGKAITREHLSSILYYVSGATQVVDTKAGEVLLKTSPSGGGRHAIEVYPCILNVEGVEPGIYHHSVKNDDLELIARGDFRESLPKMCGDQVYTRNASALFFYTAVVERARWKYESARTYRVLMMDLGHLSQTFYLVATWLGLGAFFTAALRDELVEQRLGVNSGEEIVLGTSGLGVVSSGGREDGRKAFAGLAAPID